VAEVTKQVFPVSGYFLTGPTNNPKRPTPYKLLRQAAFSLALLLGSDENPRLSGWTSGDFADFQKF